MSGHIRLVWGWTAFMVGSGCTIEQQIFYQAPIDGVPGVADLGVLTPVSLDDPAILTDEIIYGEVGPTGSSLSGGITFSFVGDGGPVCVFVDPETISWNQSVSVSDPIPNFSFPDNLFDDGDLDVTGGLSVYYTGTPGQAVGSFEIPYQDSLGTIVYADLVECIQTSDVTGATSIHAGRGSPESCTIDNTIEGVSYTVLLQTYSVPFDDLRLGYGLLVADGACDELDAALGGAAQERYGRECVIKGESIKPGSAQGAVAAERGYPSPTWVGSEKPSWDLSEDFEDAFCNENLRNKCRNEEDSVIIQGDSCSWQEAPEATDGPMRRCFCGNPEDTPTGGSL